MAALTLTKIELSMEDATMFKEFCKQYKNFDRMVRYGVFDTKNGMITMNFDQNGIIQRVVKTENLYEAYKQNLTEGKGNV